MYNINTGEHSIAPAPDSQNALAKKAQVCA